MLTTVQIFVIIQKVQFYCIYSLEMRNGMKKAWPHIKCELFIVVLAVVILVCDYLFAESGYIRFVLNDVNSSNESYDTIVLGASQLPV